MYTARKTDKPDYCTCQPGRQLYNYHRNFQYCKGKTCSLCGENKDYFEKEKEEAFNEEKI